MNENLRYPKQAAMESVLTKIGVDPATRDSECQDFEYTSCVLSELNEYLDLYYDVETSIDEKRILGSYFLQCLNEHASIEKTPHQRQSEAFQLLHTDIAIHSFELEYFTDIEEKEDEPELWWPIASHIFEWRENQGIN